MEKQMQVLDICVKKIKQSIDKITSLNGFISTSNFEEVFEPALNDIQMIALQVADMQAVIYISKDKGILKEQETEIEQAGLLAIKALTDINMEIDRLTG
jgi:hypothetical protein